MASQKCEQAAAETTRRAKPSIAGTPDDCARNSNAARRGSRARRRARAANANSEREEHRPGYRMHGVGDEVRASASNENKISDRGRERASQTREGLESWKV